MTGIHSLAVPPEAKTGHQVMQTAGQSLHPRRSPPRNVKYQPGAKRLKLSNSSDEMSDANVPITQLKSQGSGSDQSASRWFDNANKHVSQNAADNPGYDDEPPFFVDHRTNYPPNVLQLSEGSRMFGMQSRMDSENEDLRGIVDDLTVENKRLKQILRLNRQSQRNSPSTDDQDKLFEVRMHGLSSEKRRELEFLLKNFATSLHTSALPTSGSVDGSSFSSGSNAILNGKAKTDSGYASNSNSGNPSRGTRPHGAQGSNTNTSQSSRDRSTNNHLHDIPDTLMPRQKPIVLSERSKMALVVRRLEQLFTGRTAAPGEHSQPLQQQEVSNSAARADEKTSRKRKVEGSREAHILPPDSRINFDAVEMNNTKRKKSSTEAVDSETSIAEELPSAINRPDSPDQRPTRPLDLDIHRAQVAAENIQYIRHLGLSSPHIEAASTDESWMYVNLLVNMAQLHTFNVTPAFVRKALQKMSTKFELSKDGHKVRWVGGPEGTKFSKEEEKALEVADNTKDGNTPDESSEENSGSSSKRSKTDSTSNAVASNTTSEDKTSGLQTSSASKNQISTGATSNMVSSRQSKTNQSGSAFDYRPIVYRGPAKDVLDETYLVDSDESVEDTSRDSSGLAYALSRSNLREQRNTDEGTITFYNNAYFCSDYGGDKKPGNMLPPRDAIRGHVIGIYPGDYTDGDVSRLAGACYFTPQFGPRQFKHIPEENLPMLDLVPLSQSLGEELQPIELVASGLGGIVPDDNFAIDTTVHLVPTNDGRVKPWWSIPFTGTQIKSRYMYQMGRSHRINLLPPRLPSPSYIFFTSSSSSGNQVEDDEDASSVSGSDKTGSSADEDHPAPPSFLQHWSADNSGHEQAEKDDPDDSSVDMLATARAVDPIRVAEQERQYLIHEPGGRAVAGSLAATVGASRSATSIGASSGSSEADVVDDDVESDVDMDQV